MTPRSAPIGHSLPGGAAPIGPGLPLPERVAYRREEEPVPTTRRSAATIRQERRRESHVPTLARRPYSLLFVPAFLTGGGSLPRARGLNAGAREHIPGGSLNPGGVISREDQGRASQRTGRNVYQGEERSSEVVTCYLKMTLGAIFSMTRAREGYSLKRGGDPVTGSVDRHLNPDRTGVYGTLPDQEGTGNKGFSNPKCFIFKTLERFSLKKEISPFPFNNLKEKVLR